MNDPVRRSIAVGVALVLAGLVALVVAWASMRGEEEVPYQLPYVVSGGLSGIALVVCGAVVVRVQVDRLASARRRARLAALLEELRR